jgi:hypothetical protein
VRSKHLSLADETALSRSWTHAHEQDSGGRLVFRPSESDFPPARGRRSIDLRPDGTLLVEEPGADDRPVTRAGRWRLEGEALTLSVEGRGEERFEVEAVDQHQLVLRRA